MTVTLSWIPSGRFGMKVSGGREGTLTVHDGFEPWKEKTTVTLFVVSWLGDWLLVIVKVPLKVELMELMVCTPHWRNWADRNFLFAPPPIFLTLRG